MNTLNIRERQIEDIIILDMEGSLRIGDSSVLFRKTIRQLLSEEHDQILLNLAGVSYIDSSALGEIISGYAVLKKVGGKLKLLHLTQKVRELMIITKLLTIFDVYDNESEAIESFSYKPLEFEEARPKLIKEHHNKPFVKDMVPPENHMFANYLNEFHNSRAQLGFVQESNRSSVNTDRSQPLQEKLTLDRQC